MPDIVAFGAGQLLPTFGSGPIGGIIGIGLVWSAGGVYVALLPNGNTTSIWTFCTVILQPLQEIETVLAPCLRAPRGTLITRVSWATLSSLSGIICQVTGVPLTLTVALVF